MPNNIDVQAIAKEVYDDVIGDFNDEVAAFRPKLTEAVNDLEALIIIIFEMSECLRRHSERFSTELVKGVVERLGNQTSDS